MLFDLTFLCYLTTFSGKKCLSGKVICDLFCPAYRNSPVLNSEINIKDEKKMLVFTILLLYSN
jgi:hypothetical protein